MNGSASYAPDQPARSIDDRYAQSLEIIEVFVKDVQRRIGRQRLHVLRLLFKRRIRFREQHVRDIHTAGRATGAVQQQHPAGELLDVLTSASKIAEEIPRPYGLPVRKGLRLHETTGDIRGIGNQATHLISDTRAHLLQDGVGIHLVHRPQQIGTFVAW